MVHYANHDTRLTHGHRILRLAEDFEMLPLVIVFLNCLSFLLPRGIFYKIDQKKVTMEPIPCIE